MTIRAKVETLYLQSNVSIVEIPQTSGAEEVDLGSEFVFKDGERHHIAVSDDGDVIRETGRLVEGYPNEFGGKVGGNKIHDDVLIEYGAITLRLSPENPRAH